MLNNIWNILDARSEGGPVGPLLTTEIKRHENCPLDESKGEGWHRGTNLTKQRAAASRAVWVLGSARHEQSLTKCLAFCQSNPELSNPVFRYEWAKFKRILRTSGRDSWRPVKMQDKLFYERLYGMDSSCRDDWGPLVHDPTKVSASDERTDLETSKYEHPFLQTMHSRNKKLIFSHKSGRWLGLTAVQVDSSFRKSFELVSIFNFSHGGNSL